MTTLEQALVIATNFERVACESKQVAGSAREVDGEIRQVSGRSHRRNGSASRGSGRACFACGMASQAMSGVTRRVLLSVVRATHVMVWGILQCVAGRSRVLLDLDINLLAPSHLPIFQ
jgi:hypothetical protein